MRLTGESVLAPCDRSRRDSLGPLRRSQMRANFAAGDKTAATLLATQQTSLRAPLAAQHARHNMAVPPPWLWQHRAAVTALEAARVRSLLPPNSFFAPDLAPPTFYLPPWACGASDAMPFLPFHLGPVLPPPPLMQQQQLATHAGALEADNRVIREALLELLRASRAATPATLLLPVVAASPSAAAGRRRAVAELRCELACAACRRVSRAARAWTLDSARCMLVCFHALCAHRGLLQTLCMRVRFIITAYTCVCVLQTKSRCSGDGHLPCVRCKRLKVPSDAGDTNGLTGRPT